MTTCNYEDCEMEVWEESNENKCIFHDPSPYKSGELFKEELVKQLKSEGRNKRFWFKGYYFPEDCCDLVSLVEEATGERAFKEAFFDKAIFEGVVSFISVAFKGWTGFQGATFKGGADFQGATFKQTGYFLGATFKEEAGFNGATFKGRGYFRGATFKEGAFFQGATFKEWAYFSKSLLNIEARFSGTLFERVCLFNGAVFMGKLNFSQADFRQGIKLVDEQELREGAKISAVNIDEEIIRRLLSFKGYIKRLEIETKLNEENQNERGRSIDSGNKTNIERVIFKKEDNTKEKLHKLIDLLRELPLKDRKGDCSWLEVLEDAGEKISKKVEEGDSNKLEKEIIEELAGKIEKESGGGLLLENRVGNITMVAPKFGSNDDTRHGAKEEGCRVQRISYEKEGKKEEADKMFVEEMRARRAQKEAWWERELDKVVADWTCKYGTSWERVLGISLGLIGSFSLLYLIFNIISMYTPLESYIGELNLPSGSALSFNLDIVSFFRCLGNSIYYSSITFTNLGYGDLHPSGFMMKALSTMESVLGALFVALIIVVFARKWMRG